MKFTEQGEVVVRVNKVHDSQEGAVIRVEVADTGIGISTEHQGRLFQSFTQADGSVTRTELVIVYCVNDEGKVLSLRAFWEFDDTVASIF